MAAQKNKFFFLCKLLSHLLVEHLSLRSHINHPGLLLHLLLNMLISQIDRLRLHDHSGTAAVWIIVHFFMLVPRKIPDVYGFHTDMSRLFCTA